MVRMKMGIQGVECEFASLKAGDIFFGINEGDWGPFLKIKGRVKRGHKNKWRDCSDAYDCIQLNTGEFFTFGNSFVLRVDPIMVFNQETLVQFDTKCRQ